MSIRTLNELFFRAVEEHDKPDAFLHKIGGAYRPVSHREALEAVEELSLGLLSLGVAPGDRVALFSENRLEWALVDYAILSAGAITVPIYPTLPGPQVEYIIGDSGARTVFVSLPVYRAGLESIRDRLPEDLRVICLDPFPSDVSGLQVLEALRERGRELAAADPGRHRAVAGRVGEEDLASIIYTSGTTGKPKGVMLTHANLVSNVLACLAFLDLGPSDTCLSFLPLSHILERMAGHYTMFHAGATIAYAESADTLPENLLEIRPTVMLGVPRIYEKMHARVREILARASPLQRGLFHWGLEAGRRRSRLLQDGRPVPWWLKAWYRAGAALAFARLKARTGGRIRFMISGGAPLDPEIFLFFHAAGLVILEGYGLTETSPVISCNRPEALKPGTVGQPIPGTQVMIAEDGEILVQGPGVMQGYWGMPEATREILEGGWLHTGDIGFLDADGFLTITDRKKDLIVTAGGKNVAPQPIENRLKADPEIAEAALIGDRRPFIVALLVPDFERLEAWAQSRGIAGDHAALCRDPRVIDHFMARVAEINRDLAPFEQIKRIGLIDRPLSIDSGDLTPTLKVKRRVLAERFRGLIEGLYAGGEGEAPRQ